MTSTEMDAAFLRAAFDLANEGMRRGDGGPFGCVIVKDGVIIGRGNNKVISANDPTAHAEIVAIRDACKRLGDFQLMDCVIYTSCEPCPMCLGAIYWSRPVRIVFAGTREDAADAGFDDRLIYEELARSLGDRIIPMTQLLRNTAQQLFRRWKEMPDKELY